MNIKTTEHQHQSLVCRYLDILQLQGKILTYFAIPNGGKRDAKTASIMKREGVRAGVSDLCIISKDKVVFIEMKKDDKTKSRLSKSQIDFQNTVKLSNVVQGVVCYGSNDALQKIKELLNPS